MHMHRKNFILAVRYSPPPRPQKKKLQPPKIGVAHIPFGLFKFDWKTRKSNLLFLLFSEVLLLEQLNFWIVKYLCLLLKYM